MSTINNDSSPAEPSETITMPPADNGAVTVTDTDPEQTDVIIDTVVSKPEIVSYVAGPEKEAAATPPQQTELVTHPTTITTTTTQRPTTPIPAKKFLSKRPNLSLKITNESGQYAETENATLSNTKPPRTSSSSSASANSASTTASVFPHEQNRVLKKLDIGFRNIAFAAKEGFFKREIKSILNGLTGEFRCGELSAIVGPSGAGKSSFLNILSAYKPFGHTGDVTVNGHVRDIKAFKPNVAFIMQDTSLQPYLTVKEAMHFSANLKIGSHMTSLERRERVRKILEAIGMNETRNTRTMNLSGGQKKRLAIALELVNNPPVLIMDEPTSGLDSSTANQLISLLKKLAMEGRTVICTIHQPSALAFQMFDHMYAIAEGKCIFAGGTKNLVPFLAEADLNCPESYNPVDYLMEIATDDYGKQNDKLVEKMQNGRNNSYRQEKASRKVQMEAMVKIDKMMASAKMTPVTAPVLTNPLKTASHSFNMHYDQPTFKQLSPINEMTSKVWDNCGLAVSKEQPADTSCCKPKKKKPQIQLDPPNLCHRENIYATPFYRQLYILLVRTFLIIWRDPSLTTMRFIIHLVTGLLIGFLYWNIGNDAGNALNNFRYAFYTIMFIMYCAFSSILVKFPLEFPIVSREHFNRWYSLRAYYVAMTLAEIPIQLICSSLFIFPTYIMTGQPWEFMRFGLFSIIIFLTALVGQSIGLAVGASLSVKLGAIFGPFFICPFLAFSGFFLQHKDSPVYFQWVFSISFLKYSLDGAMLALFGYDRPKLECNSMYCHYSRPQVFLKDMDMVNANYELAAVFLLLLFIGLRIISFYIMSFRLRLFR